MTFRPREKRQPRAEKALKGSFFIDSSKQKELAAAEDCPKMCAYKLVTIKFKWWGLQNKIENFIQKVRSWEGLSLSGDKGGTSTRLPSGAERLLSRARPPP